MWWRGTRQIRMRNRRLCHALAGASLALLALEACVPRAAPPPAPLPAPAPAPQPVSPPPPPAPAASTADWQTGPLSPGDWRYRAGGARFQSQRGSVDIVCEQREIQIILISDESAAPPPRLGAVGADAIIIVTSYGTRTLNAVLSNPRR